MIDCTIPPDVLDDLDIKITQALDAVKAAKGQKVDRVQELCDLVGISKQSLAGGIILENKGDISQIEIARILNIHERTLRKRSWHKIRTLLKKSSRISS